MNNELPSWNDTEATDRLRRFLAASDDVPPFDRVALFDNDGTLWAERPQAVQGRFAVEQLRARAAREPEFAERPEFRAVLDDDEEAINRIGIPQIADALVAVGAGMTPEEYLADAVEFVYNDRHPQYDRTPAEMTYQPMQELLAALHRRAFHVFVVTGGGTEFVRAFVADLYGVPRSRVIGSMVGYEHDASSGQLRRTDVFVTGLNEGLQKLKEIQWMVGHPPILAAGNSAGDTEMLNLAQNNPLTAGTDAALSLLIVHDDADREFAYDSKPTSWVTDEDITDVAARDGWTQVSIKHDWSTVFADAPHHPLT